jgi:hypothetical protein
MDKTQVAYSEPFKLKDQGRSEILIDFMQTIGYLPELIVIEKVEGQNNRLRLGIFPKDYLTNKKRIEERAKRVEKVKKMREAKKDSPIEGKR